MPSRFRMDPDREPWERQPGEGQVEFQWFDYWLTDFGFRSVPRVADKFATTRGRVRGVKERHQWLTRLNAWYAHQSKAHQDRFNTTIEAALAPLAQGMMRLALHATRAPTDDLPADKALNAATNVLRVVKEPEVKLFIQHAEDTAQDVDLAELVLARLGRDFPEAHRAALDEVRGYITGSEIGDR